MKKKRLRLKKGVKEILLLSVIFVSSLIVLSNLNKESREITDECIKNGNNANWCFKEIWG